ncbi:MAG TPA: YDG domain-containing protein [Bacteroidales bacterium]|nr:YDG domain-containing protein [Bacteroidales bacterium]
METIYKARRLRRAGMVLAALFAMMLLLPTYTAFGQPGTNKLNLTIECYGIVKVKVAGNLEAVAVVEGPEDLSVIYPPAGFPASGVYYLKVIPFPGYQFTGWAGMDGPDVFSIVPTPPVPLPTETQGYQYGITMDTEKDLTALFDMIPLAPPAVMPANYTVKTIPGTSVSASGTPFYTPVSITYPVILAGSYPGVKADMLLHTDRDGGFGGLRLLELTPNPCSPTPCNLTSISLGDVPGVYGVDGNDILLSTLYDMINGPSSYIPPTLESMSGVTVNYLFIYDGIMNGSDYDFNIEYNAIAYKDASLDYGDELCETELADTEVHIMVAPVTQTLAAGAATGSGTAPITITQCDGQFVFNTTTTYPAIQAIDLAGEIKNNGWFKCDKFIPAGTIIAWNYNSGAATGSYTVPAGGWAANSTHYLSLLTGAGTPTPLVGHNGLTTKWVFTITLPAGDAASFGIFNLQMQSVAQLGGPPVEPPPGFVQDYDYGTTLNVTIVNTKAVATVVIPPAAIESPLVGTPVIIPVTTTITLNPAAPDPDYTAILLNGRISLSNYTYGAKIIGARANGSTVSLTTAYPTGVALGAAKTFDQIFATGWAKDLGLVSVTSPINWEFDLVTTHTSAHSFSLTVELFTSNDGVTNCVLASDAVAVTFNPVSPYTSTPGTIQGCLNFPINFALGMDFPNVIENEPLNAVAPLRDIYTDILFTFDRKIVQNTKLAWSLGANNGIYTFASDWNVGDPALSMVTIVNNPAVWQLNKPLVELNNVTLNWNFSMTIPNADNAAAMVNGGTYVITIQPLVKLAPYNNILFLTAKTITLNIPYNTLTMAANPDFAGTTDPVVGDYEVACGAIWAIDAEPSPLGGWGFNFWSDMACPHSFFGNPWHAGTTYMMPNCDATVTANFLQKLYTLTIGVIGCNQDVVIWPEYGSTAIATLNGNRECAILDENGGWDPLIPRTFTHGETVIIEVIPEEGWVFGEWLYCSPTDDEDPLSDPDFTYIGVNDDGHHMYELIFRSDKDLKAKFVKVVTANPVVASKTYDSSPVATITGGTYDGFVTNCPTFCTTLPWYQVGASAAFVNEHVGNNITVTVTGLTLTPTAWDCGYILGPITSYSTSTGYPIANSTFTTSANITKRLLTVSAVAANKVYDGNTTATLTSTTVGNIVALDDLTYAFSNANFVTKNVGTNITVTYTVTLSGTDAVNYQLPSPLQTFANITCRPLVRLGIQACPKEYDGTTAATICNWGSWQTGVTNEGVVSGECVQLNTAAAVANFEDIYVDDVLNVNVTGLSLYGTGCPTGHTSDYTNYCLKYSTSTGTGTIQVPPYAMFDPSYQLMCGTSCEPDIVNVPIERNFTVAFDRPIFTNQGLQLPTSGAGMGNFIRLEKWVGAGTPPCHVYNYPDPNWVYVPFWSTRNGQVITVFPGTPETETRVDLQWNTFYRIRFGDIWAYNDITDVLVPIAHRLDQNGLGVFDNTVDCSLEQARQIIFKTIPQLISPVVEPSGCVAGIEIPYNAPIKITFVNPVKYTNGNMISGEVGEPTHKFQLQAKSKYASPPDVWHDVIFQATASQFEEALPQNPGTFGPRVITLVPLANLSGEYPTYLAHPGGEMLHCYDYRVVWRDGMADDGAGFIDMCDFGRVGANADFPAEGSYLPWTWCTTCKFDVQISYQANSNLGFPNPGTAIKNNMFLKEGSTTLKDLNLNGTNYALNGKELTYKVNMLTYPHTYGFVSFIGNGYHINNWTRNTSVWFNGSSWKYQAADPGIAWDLFTNQNQVPAPPVYPVAQHPYINWVADPAVPFSIYRFNVVYDINLYNIYAKADPAQSSNTSGVSFTGGTPFYGTNRTQQFTHNDMVNITARPKVTSTEAWYNTGWTWNQTIDSKSILPASITVTATNYLYNPELPAKPTFVNPKDGTISFKMAGTDLIHNSTYGVQANFAPFYPRIDVTVEPAMPGCNYVTYTAKFVQGENWGIKFASNNYAVFFYGTPITLTPHVCECGWEFSHYLVWDGVNSSSRNYVPFTPTEWMPITSNLDIKAIFVKTAYHISAVTNPNTKGSVLIEGVNADDEFVQLIDAAAAAGDDFIFETPLTLTVYPEPGWECIGFNNDNVVLVEEYIDRSVWSYVVGANSCEQPYALVANLALREYVIKGLPYYNGTQNTTGGKVVGAPAGSGLNKFTNSTSAGTAIGTFQHFQQPTPFTLTANANQYYKLSYWYDETYGNIGSANPLTLPIVTEARTIRAIFDVDLPTYPLTVNHSPVVAGDESVTQNGYTRSEPYQFYKHNQVPGFPSVIAVTAVPVIGWEFVNWTIVSGGITTYSGYGVNNITIKFDMPANAVVLRANYKKIDYTLDLVCRTYLRPVDPCDCNIVNYGLNLQDITPGSDGIYNFGDVLTLKATPIPGFTFVNWMVGELSDYDGCGDGERSGGDCILTGWEIDPPHAPRPYPQSMTFTYTIPAQWDETVVLYALAIESAFPQYPIYSLVTSDYPDGKGVTWGDGNYPETVVAMVDQSETTPGWGFEYWDVNYVEQEANPLGIYMDEDKDAVAVYGLIEYELNLYNIGCGQVWAQDYDYQYNIEDDPIPIHAEADCCNYDFVGWFYDYNCTIPVTDALGNPVTDPDFGFIPIPEDVTIFGLFEEFYYDVEITQARDACDSGLLPLGCTAEVISGDGPYALDEVVTLLATPGPGYNFAYWANPMCEMIVEEAQFNHTILCQWNDFVAVFEAIPYNVTLTANPTAGGSVAGGGVYYIGDNVTVTATPTVGWVFSGWYQGATLKSSNPSYTFTMPAADVALEARFTITTVTLTVTIDGPSLTSVTVKNGSTVLTAPYVVNYGTVLTLDPEPNGLWLNWTGDLTGTANPATLTMNGNKAVVAHFAACNPVTSLASTTTAKSATVTWTTPTGQTAELRYKKSTAAWPTTAPFGWAAATSPKTLTALTPGTLYNVEVRTVCGTGIYATTVAGTFTTKLLGDVNCDGVVNVLDVIVLTNYIMGTQASTPCILDGGDLNGDGQINVLDVVALINIVLGNNNKGTVMSVPADIYLTPGVIMLSSDGTMAGLQFELTGPQVRDLNLTLNLEGFELLYTVEGNTLSGMIYNLDNEPIPTGMINLITMKGDGVIEWGNVIGANFGESEIQVNKHGALDDEFTLMVYPNPSQGEINALFSVPYDSKVNIRLLDFSGRVISELTDAVYTYGEHLINWTNSQTLTTGLYILQMNAISDDAPDKVFRQEVKVVIIK